MSKKAPNQDETWVMQDGRRVPVGDMTEEHVKNVLRMLLRKSRLAAEAGTEYTTLTSSYTKGVI